MAVRRYQKVVRYVNLLRQQQQKRQASEAPSLPSPPSASPHPSSPPPAAASAQPSLDELHLSCLLNLSACRLSEGKASLALEAAEAALELRPEHPKALFRRGCAHLQAGDPRAAVQDLLAAQKALGGDKAVGRKLAEAKRAADSQRARERRAFSAFLAEGAGSEQGGR